MTHFWFNALLLWGLKWDVDLLPPEPAAKHQQFLLSCSNIRCDRISRLTDPGSESAALFSRSQRRFHISGKGLINTFCPMIDRKQNKRFIFAITMERQHPFSSSTRAFTDWRICLQWDHETRGSMLLRGKETAPDINMHNTFQSMFINTQGRMCRNTESCRLRSVCKVQ